MLHKNDIGLVIVLLINTSLEIQEYPESIVNFTVSCRVSFMNDII